MGEVDQVIAEPDGLLEEEEEEGGEGVEGLHPHHLDHQDPRLITLIYHSVTWYLGTYGWFVVCLLVLGYFAWINIEPHLQKWLRKREEEREASEYKKNPDALIAKHQHIDKARQRMQEQYNIAAAVSLQKKKEMEEKMRESKIAEFEQQQAEGGARRLGSQDKSTSRGATVNASTSRGAKEKSGAKQKLRPEYNPLTGDVGGGGGDSCRWRPSGRGSSGGG